MALRAGFAFRPSDDELIRVFFRPKIAGDPLDGFCGTFIHEADVCSAAPARLTAEQAHASDEAEGRVWFFFSPVRYRNNGRGRRLRAVGNDEGCWHSEAAAKDVTDATGRRMGYRQSFSYRCKNGIKPGWLMVEIGTDQEVGGASAALVVCKVYRSPRAPRGAEETCEAAASVSAPSRGKRKADDDEHPDAPPSARPREGRDDELERIKRDLLFDEPSDEADGNRAMLEFFGSDLLMGGEPSVPPSTRPREGRDDELERIKRDLLFDEPSDEADGDRSMLEFFGRDLLMGGDPSVPPQCTPQAEPTSYWTEGHMLLGEASSDEVLPQCAPQDMPDGAGAGSEQMAPTSSWTEWQMLEFIAVGGSLGEMLGEASSGGVPPQCAPQDMPDEDGAE